MRRALAEEAVHALQKGFGFGIAGKAAFGGAELGRVDAAAGGAFDDGDLDVEHLVVHDEVDDDAGDAGVVEEAAEDDEVVMGIVVAEEGAGALAAPAELGTRDGAAEVLLVDGVEDLVEVIAEALGRRDELTAAGLAQFAEVLAELVAVDELAIGALGGGGDGLAVELGKEDPEQAFDDGGGGIAQEVADANDDAAIAEADAAAEGGKRAKLDSDGGKVSAGLEGGKDPVRHRVGRFGSGGGNGEQTALDLHLFVRVPWRVTNGCEIGKPGPAESAPFAKT